MVTILRIRRMTAGHTQREEAERVGVSLPIYAAIERGELRPSPRVSALFERAFGEPIAALRAPVRPRTAAVKPRAEVAP